MLEVKGLNIESLPFEGLVLVQELLSFQDAPLLLHFTDNNNNDILSYWVDFNDTFTRWLLVKITKTELHNYLTGKKTLKNIFLEIEDYFFLVDYAEDNSIQNVKLITPYNLSEKYLPGEDSYYVFGLSDYYFKYLENLSLK